MRIDCNLCGATDRVWGANVHGGRGVPETMEVGTNYVSCRACKQTGYADLDVECANCKGHNLWRWVTRSMDTNTRRWMCRNCQHVTASHEVAVMYQTFVPSKGVVGQYSRRDVGLCAHCNQGTLKIDGRDRMEQASCFNTICNQTTHFTIHDKGAPTVPVVPPVVVSEPEEPLVPLEEVFDDEAVLSV